MYLIKNAPDTIVFVDQIKSSLLCEEREALLNRLSAVVGIYP
jgi:hypothetical protein